MRELVRADLPEALLLVERIGSLIARSSTGFALLAGIGAALLVGDVLRTIASGVLQVAPIADAPRPYDFQRILGPAAGVVVAGRAGGIAGALAYLGYSGVVLAVGWVGRMLTCADGMSRGELGLGSFCTFGPLDLLAGAAPLLIVLAIGAIFVRIIDGAPRAGVNPLLEAAGAHVVPSVIFALGARAFEVEASGVSGQQVAFAVITVIGGALAGTVAGLRSTTPLRSAALLTAVLIATWLYPLGATQLAMAAGAYRPEIFLFALPLLDLVTIPLAAFMVSRARNA